MSQFNTARLVDGRVLVTGTDTNGVSGQTVVDASEWDELKANQSLDTATEAFDAAVAAFFAPLVEAADKLTESIEVPKDPASYVVVSEAIEGVPSQERVLHHLSNDSIVLRLIEEGQFDRLVWVSGQLVVTVADTPLPVQVDTAVATSSLPADASLA